MKGFVLSIAWIAAGLAAFAGPSSAAKPPCPGALRQAVNALGTGSGLTGAERALMSQGRVQEAAWELHARGKVAEAEALSRALEGLLGAGEIKLVKRLEAGAHRPYVYELPDGQLGLFKANNVLAYHEVAAYRFDRLLGFGVVPVTVIRKVGGRIGSMQAFLEQAGTPKRMPSDGPDARIRLFDYLINNGDRTINVGNLLIVHGTGRQVAIDNGLGFESLFSRHGEEALTAADAIQLKPDPGLLARLRALSLPELKRELAPLIGPRRAQRVWRRLQNFLSLLEHAALPD